MPTDDLKPQSQPDPNELTPEEEAAVEHYLIHESTSDWKKGLSQAQIEEFVRGSAIPNEHP